MTSTSLDDALRFIGKYGRYQVFACIIITIIGAWFPPLHIMGVIFSVDRPLSYHCIQWSDARGDVLPVSSTRHEKETFLRAKGSDPKSYFDAVKTDDECIGSLGVNVTSEDIICTDWKYYTEYNESTIVTQLNLVCDRKILVELLQTSSLFGMLVGSLMFGYLSDTFGRKKTLLGACIANGVVGIGVSFVWSYPGILVMWFLVGVCAQGYNQVQFVTIMEMFPPECRTLLGSCNTMFWGVGVATIAPIAYILRNWRDMQIAISVPCFVAAPLFCILDDSVRWLLSMGRTDDAMIVVNKMACCNGVTPPTGGFVLTKVQKDDDDVQHVEESRETNDNFTKTPKTSEPIRTSCRVKDVFKNRRVLLNMCVVMFMWLTSTMTYYAASINATNLAGNKYLNFSLLGLAEIPGYILIFFTMTWWGRRPSLCLFFFIAGAASFTTAFLPAKSGNGADLTVVIIAVAVLVKLFIVCAYTINLICCTELLPTPLRNFGFGIGSVFGSIGFMAAPFVLYLADFAAYLPLSVFGSLCITSSLLVIALPETKDNPLPETIEEAANIGRQALKRQK